MSALLVLLVAVALLLPAAPFALDYGHHAIHARRHAACLRRIAALEVDLGMRAAPTMRPLDDRMREALDATLEYHLPQAAADRAFVKVWEKNRKRLARVRYPDDRR